ncbi:MAG: hypothetical protein Q8P67_24485 [archaeon]|nr:hypothetical protein [archaeon]
MSWRLFVPKEKQIPFGSRVEGLHLDGSGQAVFARGLLLKDGELTVFKVVESVKGLYVPAKVSKNNKMLTWLEMNEGS